MVEARNIIFMITCCLVFGLFTASCIGAEWGRINAKDLHQSFQGHIGLWKGCGLVNYMMNETCVDLTQKTVHPDIILVRGFSILAIIFSAATVILACIMTEKGHSIKDAGKGMAFVAGLGVVAGIVFMINIGRFKDDMRVLKEIETLNYNFQYGRSYYLNWVGVAGATAAALIALFAKDVDQNQATPEAVWLFEKSLEPKETFINEDKFELAIA
uniref:Uncharacterized protein n=1 Tax=Clytia hemisphaerica TaxID=252671 RepID=A0A7M5WYE1_9CNID